MAYDRVKPTYLAPHSRKRSLIKLFHELENGPVNNEKGLACPHRRSGGRGEFRPRQTRQLPRAVDLKGRLLSCQSY